MCESECSDLTGIREGKFRKVMMSLRVDKSGISMCPLERGAESSRSFQNLRFHCGAPNERAANGKNKAPNRTRAREKKRQAFMYLLIFFSCLHVRTSAIDVRSHWTRWSFLPVPILCAAERSLC